MLLLLLWKNLHPLCCSPALSACEPLEGNCVTCIPELMAREAPRDAWRGVGGAWVEGLGPWVAEEKEAEQTGNRPVKQGERPKLF